MTKNEEKRINQFIKGIIESKEKLATQLPGDDKHTIVLPMTAIMSEWSAMVKDLEAMRDDEENI